MNERVVVYTRVGCPACARAEEDVARICGELGESWRAVDVDSAPELQAEYGDRVPVIDVDGREHTVVFADVVKAKIQVEFSRKEG